MEATREIQVASLAGFCFGVKRAVDCLNALLAEKKEGESVATLGQLIHNRHVIADFSAKGVQVWEEDDLDRLAESLCPEHPLHLFIRTHGARRETLERLEQLAAKGRGLILHDVTCPFVRKIHTIVSEHTDSETPLVVYGKPEHPEVAGIVSYAKGEVFVVSDAASLGATRFSRPPCVVAQTTSSLDEWKKVKAFFENHCTKAKIFDTICSVTEQRQKEAEALACRCDCMVVVGGASSANTRSLCRTVEEHCPLVYFVEDSDGLPACLPRHCSLIGITAGASTPRYIIEEVKVKMSEIKENMEENFAEMLEGTLKTLNTGDIVKGVITSITSTEIHVDLSTKGTGILPADEMPIDPVTGQPAFKVGDEIEASVVRVSDVEGVVGLSRKKIERKNRMGELVTAKEEGTILSGKVTGATKGGVIIGGNCRVFVPASRTGLAKEADLSQLVGTVQEYVIIDVEEGRGQAVGSIRDAARKRRKQEKAAFWDTLTVGQKFEGKVKSLTSYGAFVDLGGTDGMVHITELSWAHLRKPEEVVAVGDTLTVYVKSFDREKERISLTCKTPDNNPWNIFMSQFKEGDVATVKIVNITSYGAFAEVLPHLDGLIHISQIADKKIENPADYLTVGQEVEAKIIGIDTEHEKISLSIRALLENGEEAEETGDATGSAEAADTPAEEG